MAGDSRDAMDPVALAKEVELLRERNSKLVEMVSAQHLEHPACSADDEASADLPETEANIRRFCCSGIREGSVAGRQVDDVWILEQVQ